MKVKGSSNSGICISWNGEHKEVKGSSSSGIFMSRNGVSEKKEAGVKEDLDISKTLPYKSKQMNCFVLQVLTFSVCTIAYDATFPTYCRAAISTNKNSGNC